MVWDEPPMATGLDVAVPQWRRRLLGMQLPVGPLARLRRRLLVHQGARRQAAADCCYGFGGVVERSEHCNAFVYYYPELASDITCM